MIVAAVAVAIAFANTSKTNALKDFGRITAFASHAKMLKQGDTSRALASLEGLMEHGYKEMDSKGLDESVIAATRRSITDYYTSTGQALPSYLNQK